MRSTLDDLLYDQHFEKPSERKKRKRSAARRTLRRLKLKRLQPEKRE